MKKVYTCTSTIPMATKLGKMVTYCWKTPPTKSCDLLIKWSRDKCKILYLHFRNTYGHQTWQSDNLPWGDPNFKIRWPFDYGVTWHMKKTYICTSTIPMATKFGRVVAYVWKTLTIKFCDLLITWLLDKCKTLYLHFCNTYDHQTWLSDNLR